MLLELLGTGVFRLCHGSQLVYNACWEDPRLDRMALQIGPDDHAMEQLARKYVLWFYSRMDRVFVFSEHHRSQLLAIGLSAEKIMLIQQHSHHPAGATDSDVSDGEQLVTRLWEPEPVPQTASAESGYRDEPEAQSGMIANCEFGKDSTVRGTRTANSITR